MYFCNQCGEEIEQPEAVEITADDKIEAVTNGNEGDEICIDNLENGQSIMFKIYSALGDVEEHYHRRCAIDLVRATLEQLAGDQAST